MVMLVSIKIEAVKFAWHDIDTKELQDIDAK